MYVTSVNIYSFKKTIAHFQADFENKMKSAAKQTKNRFKAHIKSFSSHFPTLQ